MSYAWHRIGEVQHVRTEPDPIWRVIGVGMVVPPWAEWSHYARISGSFPPVVIRSGINPQPPQSAVIRAGINLQPPQWPDYPDRGK